MSTLSVNYLFKLPEVGGDSGAWGGFLNENWVSLDTTLKAVSDAGVTNAGLISANTAAIAAGVADFGETLGTKWVKYIGGQMIAQHAYQELTFNTFQFCNKEWTWPESFISPPSVFGSVYATDALNDVTPSLDELGPLMLSTTVTPNDSVLLSVYRHRGGTSFVSGDILPVRVTAIGKWQ